MMRRAPTVVLVFALGLVALAGVAEAHSHFGQMGPNGRWKDCAIEWEHAHSPSRAEAVTTNSGILLCDAINVKIHYKLDGLFYTDWDADKVPPITSTSEGTDNGYDVFYWSSHDAKPTGASYWIGGRKYH